MNSPLRILVAANVPADPNAGASGTVWQMNAALRRRGHHVREIWCDAIGRRIRHGNLHYLLELPRAYRRVVREAWRTETFDVVELNQPHAHLAALEHRASRRPGVFVNRSHGHERRSREALQPWRKHLGLRENTGLKGLASRWIQAGLDAQWRVISRAADGFVVSCSEDRDYLRNQYQVDAVRIGLITQGVPDPFLAAPPAPMDAERARRILHIGQLAFFKAPAVLAAAVQDVLRRRPDTSMTWVCSSSQHAEAAALLAPDVRDRVRFVGWMNQDQLLRILDTHGIFLFPSYFEGFGKAPLEAMSRGLPVVSSNVGGMRDYIRDGVSGCLVPPGDPSAIAREALRLLENPALLRSMGSAARRTAEQHTWDRCAADAEQFYRALLNRRPAVS